MNDFIFQVGTKVLFGTNQIEKLGKSAKEYGNKALLCYGGGSIKKTGLYDKVVALLEAEDMKVCPFGGIEPNPKLETAKKAIKLAKEEKVDLIIAVGGGSVIDTAKLVSAAYFEDGEPWDIVTGKTKVKKALPIGAILTIAATGSEMDIISVISNEKTLEKLSFGSPLVRPAFAIMDPQITFTLPQKQTAAGVADIMAHAMENYFTIEDNAFLQDSFAEAIMKTLVKYGKIAFENPENYEARANIMWASSWAINGLLMTGKTHQWSIHAAEHELSAFYDMTHGYGLAIIAPHWLRYAIEKNPDAVNKIARFGYNVFEIEKTNEINEDSEKAIKALEEFFKSMKIPMTLREENIGEEHLEEMAKAAALHRGPIIKGFVDLEAEDILEIFKRSL